MEPEEPIFISAEDFIKALEQLETYREWLYEMLVGTPDILRGETKKPEDIS